MNDAISKLLPNVEPAADSWHVFQTNAWLDRGVRVCVWLQGGGGGARWSLFST
jgi:hypothetical protein